MSTLTVQQPVKFADPDVTAKGDRRASVKLQRLETLWFNTGTQCNIECENCYIESSPSNDRLVFLTAAEVADYLDRIAALGLPVREIGFTGGEPFVNLQMLDMLEDTLERGFAVLLLTNAMRPMNRRPVHERLLALPDEQRDRLTFRVSLDHHTEQLHDKERGPGAWAGALEGLHWLVANGFKCDIAGRTCWGETEADARVGYARLFAAEGWPLDAHDAAHLVLFPEMDEAVEVPEITVDCWDILGVNPASMMCATSRMVVKRKGAEAPVVLSCTLLPYSPEFEFGTDLASALGEVKLNHPHCAKFCVLGGGSCSAAS